MKKQNLPDILITGLGITSAIGQGRADFLSALLGGCHRFGILRRPGRQVPASFAGNSQDSNRGFDFLGAEIDELVLPDVFPEKTLRTASFSSKTALLTLYEAWGDAYLADVDPYRIGLVVGGSNIQQRELVETYELYKDRTHFLRPTYGIAFMDTDLCGLCTELFNIRGMAYTIGGASASGQLAIIKAAEAVLSGQVDVCIAMGALMDISFWECLGFKSLGAMGSNRFSKEPALACRPFDRERDGFIYGEACGVVVVENYKSAYKRKKVKPYGQIKGWAMSLDGNRNPNPSLEGEVRVIRNTLNQAKVTPKEIDYINPHGTGSLIGDDVELKAIQNCGLSHARINATKSITGHGLSSSGTVEAIASLLQMAAGRIHPTRNLETPIYPHYNWVKQKALNHRIVHALNLSFGFGGVNTAICLKSCS